MDFYGKVVLVTGGSRGIGRSVVKEFARKGAIVVSSYKQSDDKFNDLSSDLEKEGFKIYKFKGDISITSTCVELSKYIIETFGKVDIIINNAAISKCKMIIDCDENDFNDMFNTNVKSIFNITRLLLPSMIGNKNGVIINISSIWGSVGAAMEVLYSATKGAVESYTRSLSKEMLPSGIRVNAIAPGIIDTDMNKSLSEEDKMNFLTDVSMGRMGTCEEVAEMVLFLCSEKSKYVSGQIINVDGDFK